MPPSVRLWMAEQCLSESGPERCAACGPSLPCSERLCKVASDRRRPTLVEVTLAVHGDLDLDRLKDALGQLCRRAHLGDEPHQVLDAIQQTRLVDVVLPTRQGVGIRKRCVTRPTDHQAILLDRLGLRLPRGVKLTET